MCWGAEVACCRSLEVNSELKRGLNPEWTLKGVSHDCSEETNFWFKSCQVLKHCGKWTFQLNFDLKLTGSPPQIGWYCIAFYAMHNAELHCVAKVLQCSFEIFLCCTTAIQLFAVQWTLIWEQGILHKFFSFSLHKSCVFVYLCICVFVYLYCHNYFLHTQLGWASHDNCGHHY